MYDFNKIEEFARKKQESKKDKIENAIQDDPKKPLFSFLEGPPTANAPPGLHHLEVRTFKDIICKFKYMQGFSVPRKGGWDCHGLPVEVQVEKKLKLSHKKEVEDYGIDKFIKNCRKDVFSNIEDWNKSTKQLGYWIDLENPYVTLENNYIESVWWSLKELYKKDLLYEGYKVVPFCPRCGTPLSSHEVSQGYKNVKEDSVYIAFKIKDKEYILAWTTTPWTLPGNVALAVGPKIEYVKVKLPDGDKLILAKEKLELIKGEYEIIEKIKGKDLVGLEYEPLYDIKETQNEKSHKIISADFVTTEDGTGVVHTAVMYGEDDYKVGKEAGLPEVHTVGQDGKFLDIAPEFIQGKFVKSAEKNIIEDLKKRHLLFKVEKFEHSYPHCWRCNTPLLYYGLNSWFINVPKIKEKLVELNKEINWYPEHIKEGRFGKWLESAKEWSLSRFKFWGTPLPVWRCENENCKNEKIIGSIEELKKAEKVPKGEVDLHRPWVDKVKFKCEKCGKEMSRIKDVIDCWYDSGSASFAQFHYPFENKEKFEKRFPYDFISEAIDQTRGWFYTLHVLGTILFEKPAYKNVICAGHVVDNKGEKMSKSKGNIIKPDEIITKAGVDAVRLQFCTSDAGNQKRFSYDLMKEQVLGFLNVLYNTNNFYNQLKEKENSSKVEDKWILSRLNSVIKEVTENLENYNLNKPIEKIMDFIINDFSRGYIKMTRDREDTKEIQGEVLKKVSLLIAPFVPYISEYIYSNFSKDSVHLSEWPEAKENMINKELESILSQTLEIIEAGLAKRDKQGIGLKWPLPKTTIFIKDSKKFKEIKEIIKNQLNVKEIIFKSPTSKETEFNIELDTKLTPELEAEGYAREISRKIQAFRKKLGLNKEDKVETEIIVDENFKKTLESQKEFIRDRTNSQKINVVTKGGEKFKNKEDFKIKEKEVKIGLFVIKG
jgi:isoleucyl-tRNA synthetase